jgi:ATP-dependent 26S proteasome regulatory subunit
MGYNYQDAPRESQQEYFGRVHTDNKETLQNALKRIEELEAQIERMKKYGKLLQDICDVMGNDPYMVWRGLEQRVLILWDKSEEEKGLKMAENILDRLLKIKPHEWAEIEKWEIKEND